MPSVDSGLPLWLTPKLTIPLIKDKINFGIGSVTGLFLETEAYGFGAVYSDISIGSDFNHISVGVGSAYDEGNWIEGPLLTMSGTLKVSSSISFTTENYVTRENSFYSIHAYHYIYRSSDILLQWGLLLFSDQFDLYPVPLLGLQVPFNLDLKTK